MSDQDSNFDPLQSSSNNSGFQLKGMMDYLLIIRDRWFIAITLALPVAVVFAYYKMDDPPTYYASSSLLLEPSQSIINMQKVVRDEYSAAILGIHLEKMRSRTLVDSVIAAIEKNPKDKAAILRPYIKDLKPEDPQPSVGSVVAGHFSVSLRGQGAPIMSITAWNRSGQGAALIANSVQEQYLRLLSEKSDSTYDSAIAFLEEQADEMQLKELESDKALKAFRQKHNISNLDDNKGFIMSRMGAMSGAVTSARVERLGLQTQLQQVMGFKLANKDIFELSTISGFGNITSLREELVSLMAEHSKLKDRYLEKHPKLIENLRRIESINELLDMEIDLAISDLKNRIKMAESRELEFKNERQKSEQESSLLDDISIQYGVLLRQKGVYSKSYGQIIDRLNEARITSQLENKNLKIHESAFPPAYPTTPNSPDIIKKALGIFAVVFIAIPIGLEFIDNRVKTPWDVEVFLGRDLLAGIPRISQVKESDRPLIVGNDLDEGLVESFRSLYGRIQMQSDISGSKSILVTSAIPSEGKSLLAANLAYTFANHGRKTVLVDFDLRRPGIHKFCGLENERGLLTLVEEYETSPLGLEGLPVADVMHEVFPNLFVMPSGGRTRSATEMLEKPAFEVVINLLKKECDILVLDTSPIGLFPDSLALAQKADELIYVTRYGKVARKVCKDLLNSLEETGTKILGVVLNDLPEKKTHRYYYYGNYYGYGYGYYRYKYYSKYYGSEDEEEEESKNSEKKPKTLEAPSDSMNS